MVDGELIVARILDANQPCVRIPRDRNAAPESARDSELVPKIVFSTKQRDAAKKLRVAALTSTPLHNLTRKIDNLTSETTKHPLQPTAARALTIYADRGMPGPAGDDAILAPGAAGAAENGKVLILWILVCGGCTQNSQRHW